MTEENTVIRHMASEHIVVLTINRPKVRNAVDIATGDLIERYLLEAEADHAVRVGVITGAGPVFCAGADLKEVSAKGTVRTMRSGGFAGFVATPRTKPWIAALNGPAYGGGTEVALACDMVVACDAASMALSEVKRGLMALSGGAIRLPRAIAPAVATEVLLTGEPLTAQRAFALGLVNRIVAVDEVVPEALRLAQAISDNSPFAVRRTLQLARLTRERSEDDMWRECERAREELSQCEDCREGPLAFLEKRRPRWQS